MSCDHPNMQSSARTDFCPDCGYHFYYGDAHATGPTQQSKLINPGDDAGAQNDPPLDFFPYQG